MGIAASDGASAAAATSDEVEWTKESMAAMAEAKFANETMVKTVDTLNMHGN